MADDPDGYAVYFRADAECFSKRANMVNERFKPECAECPKAALGAEIMETQGDESATFRFSCGEHGIPRNGWALIVRNISGWEPVQKIQPGIYRLTKSKSGVPSCTLQ